MKRLSELERILSNAVGYLRAKLALDSAFSTPSEPIAAVDPEAAVQGSLASGALLLPALESAVARMWWCTFARILELSSISSSSSSSWLAA